MRRRSSWRFRGPEPRRRTFKVSIFLSGARLRAFGTAARAVTLHDYSRAGGFLFRLRTPEQSHEPAAALLLPVVVPRRVRILRGLEVTQGHGMIGIPLECFLETLHRGAGKPGLHVDETQVGV